MNKLLAISCVAGIALASCKDEKKPAAAPSTPAAGVPASAPAAPAADASVVSVGGVAFPLPSGWKSVPPANAMRLAEVHVPDASGDAVKECLVTFSMAGGDVQSNVARWTGQVVDASGQPSIPAVTTRSVGGLTVTVAEMTGTYSGMSEAPKADWTLRGAIVEVPGTLLFVKMTGPAEQMKDAAGGFQAMIDGMTR